MKKSILIERPDGQVINASYAEAEIPLPPESAPLVIFVQGFPAYSPGKNGLFDTTSALLMKAGISTLQFQFTGADTKTEDKVFSFAEAAGDLETIYAWARQHGHQSFAFISEGLGSPIALMNLPKYTRFCVSFWPVYDLDHVYTKQLKADDHQDRVEEDGFFEHQDYKISSAFLDELKNTDLTGHLEKVRIPVFLLHGMQDTVIPPTQLDIARKSLMSPRLDITTFDDGRYGLEQDNHRKACFHHLKTYIQTHTGKRKHA